MEDNQQTILNCNNISQSHVTIRAVGKDDGVNTPSRKKTSKKAKAKQVAKFTIKWSYKCTLGLVIRFFKHRFLLGYYALISFNPAAILISALELGLYLFLAYQLGKDTVELFISFFN